VLKRIREKYRTDAEFRADVAVAVTDAIIFSGVLVAFWIYLRLAPPLIPPPLQLYAVILGIIGLAYIVGVKVGEWIIRNVRVVFKMVEEERDE